MAAEDTNPPTAIEFETAQFAENVDKEEAFILSRILVQFPILCFVLCLAAYSGFGGFTYWQYQNGTDIFAFDFEQLPLRLDQDIDRRRDLAWRGRNEYPGYLQRILIGRFRPWWLRGFIYDNVDVIFKYTDNLLTDNYLRDFQEIEELLGNNLNYSSSFCQKLNNGQCVKPLSLLRFFDGTYSHIDQAFNDPDFLNVTENIYKASFYNETRQHLKLLTSSAAVFTNTSVFANIVRIRFPIGGPLTYRDGFKKERPRYEKFLQDSFQPLLEDVKTNRTYAFKTFYISKMLFVTDLQKQAFLDLYWAVGSLSFIFVYMLIHTESLWITVWSSFSIGMSFLMANSFYRFVLGYAYFGFFHILSIFIILGIGADDIFVFFDIWRYNCLQTFPSNAHRLSATYRRASVSMLATSLTTMAAFMVSYMSPLLAVSTFGVYSGLLVFVNFLAAITFFPTVVLVYSLRILPAFNVFWNWMNRESDDVDNYNALKDIFLCSRNTANTIPRIGFSLVMTYITKFLTTVYYRFVKRKPMKMIGSLMFVILVSCFLVFAVRLRPDERQVQMFRTSHNYGQGQYLQSYGFGTIDEEDLTKVELTWGLKEKNTSQCDQKTSVECTGTPVFDDEFSFASLKTQSAILDVCHYLRNLTDEQLDDLRIRRNAYTNEPEMSCFMESLQTFFWKEQDRLDIAGARVYPVNYTFDLPFTEEHLSTLVQANAKYIPTLRNLAFKRPLETAIGYWLSDGWSRLPEWDYYKFKDLLGEVMLKESRSILNISALSYNTGLKYIGIEINTTLYVNILGFPEGKPIRNKWENMMNDILTEMPTSLKNGFQVTKDTWHWLRVQETLSDSAVYGLTIGLALALPILILATQNIIIAILATLTISLVTVCVVGIIPMANWRLGVLESLNLCLVVGLSVDYVVHMAEAYHRCEHYGRNERVKHMLETVGSAVLSGAITTGGSAVFMLFAQIQFLVEFGVFILSTIGFSVLFSLLGFTVLMTICGPQGDTGSLTALFKKCYYKFKGKHPRMSCDQSHVTTSDQFRRSQSTDMLYSRFPALFGADNYGFDSQPQHVNEQLPATTSLPMSHNLGMLHSGIRTVPAALNYTNKIGFSLVMTYITKFLTTVYYRFVKRKPMKMIGSLMFVILVSCFLVFAVRLRPDERQVQMFRTSHNYGQGQYLQSYGFGTIDEEDLTKVELTWGLKEKNTSQCDQKTSVECTALSYNTGLKYIGIEINTTLYVNILGFPEGKPIRNKWENMMNDILTEMPTSLKNGFQVTKDTWHWLRVQETLSDSAVYGLTIGLALALPILILATQNIIIAILATLTISLVTVCVVGIIPMANWRLGVLESLNLCLVVGLSVDYVVHMAEAYHRCEHYGRNERVKHMLETVGSAVLSGAITTGGSAVFMLFAQIQFLVEFGVFILSTIGFSVLFSLLGFTVLMTICGPQGDTGSLTALFKKCYYKFKGKHPRMSCDQSHVTTSDQFRRSQSTDMLYSRFPALFGADNYGFDSQPQHVNEQLPATTSLPMSHNLGMLHSGIRTVPAALHYTNKYAVYTKPLVNTNIQTRY